MHSNAFYHLQSADESERHVGQLPADAASACGRGLKAVLVINIKYGAALDLLPHFLDSPVSLLLKWD